MTTLTVTEVRAHLKDVIERVKRGEEVHITQNGEVVAVWLHPTRVRQRVRTPHTVAADELAEELEALRRARPRLPEPGLSAAYAEALVGEIRADRDRD